jgi:magnesium transporter
MVRTATPPLYLVKALLNAGDRVALSEEIRKLSSSELSRAIAQLDRNESARLLRLIDHDSAAFLLGSLPRSQAAELVADVQPSLAARVLDSLPSRLNVELLRRMERRRSDGILKRLESEQARVLRELARYPRDTAGGLMSTEFLAYPGRLTVQDLIDDLRANADRYAGYHVQYLYVLGRGGRLAGLVRIRDVLLAAPTTRLKELIRFKPIKVDHRTPLDKLQETFARVPYLGLPVVNSDGVMLGVVRKLQVEKAAANRNASDLRQALGIVGGEEIRTMPLLQRSGRRLSWLSVNVVLNVIAASVIVVFEDTLSQVIALAVFLPIISDMSGCSGNQAVAVSLRELALGLVRPVEVARVWFKEISVGALNGLALGVFLGLIAWFWRGSAALGLVVGAALAVNTIVAVSIGGAIPLMLKRFGVDPALASGPILTTVTDMCGFFLALGLATVMIGRLT